MSSWFSACYAPWCQTHLMPAAGRGPRLAASSQDTRGSALTAGKELCTQQNWGWWWWGNGLSNVWSHYKTSLLIRIGYHLKSSLHTSQPSQKDKNKRTPEEKEKRIHFTPFKTYIHISCFLWFFFFSIFSFFDFFKMFRFLNFFIF